MAALVDITNGAAEEPPAWLTSMVWNVIERKCLFCSSDKKAAPTCKRSCGCLKAQHILRRGEMFAVIESEQPHMLRQYFGTSQHQVLQRAMELVLGQPMLIDGRISGFASAQKALFFGLEMDARAPLRMRMDMPAIRLCMTTVVGNERINKINDDLVRAATLLVAAMRRRAVRVALTAKLARLVAERVAKRAAAAKHAATAPLDPEDAASPPPPTPAGDAPWSVVPSSRRSVAPRERADNPPPQTLSKRISFSDARVMGLLEVQSVPSEIDPESPGSSGGSSRRSRSGSRSSNSSSARSVASSRSSASSSAPSSARSVASSRSSASSSAPSSARSVAPPNIADEAIVTSNPAFGNVDVAYVERKDVEMKSIHRLLLGNFPQIQRSSYRKDFIAALTIILEEMEEEPIVTKGKDVHELALLAASKFYGKLTNSPKVPLFQTPKAAIVALRRVSPIAE